jgi:hypothetical protein
LVETVPSSKYGFGPPLYSATSTKKCELPVFIEAVTLVGAVPEVTLVANAWAKRVLPSQLKAEVMLDQLSTGPEELSETDIVTPVVCTPTRTTSKSPALGVQPSVNVYEDALPLVPPLLLTKPQLMFYSTDSALHSKVTEVEAETLRRSVEAIDAADNNGNESMLGATQPPGPATPWPITQ